VRRQALALVAATSLLVPLASGHAFAAKKNPLSAYAVPAMTGKQLADEVIAFGTTFTGRVTGTPIQLNAKAAIVAELKSFGYTVNEETYKGVLSAVTATKRGTTQPDQLIMMGAHFDVVPQSVKGTYDNGTGTNMVLALARSFAKVKTHKSVQFNFYNGEEEGALASGEQAAAYKAAGRKVSAYLGFDMTGIAWPVGGATTDANCLCMWRGTNDPQLDQVLADVNYGYLRFPAGKQKVSIEGRNVRNSDEASWADAGYRSLRWAGMRKAADYPQYHMPQDNETTIDTVAGGRKYFEMGLRNTLLSAYYTAAALDLGR
jgi:hypothetical protein